MAAGIRYAVATGRAEDNPAAHLLGAMQKPATNTGQPLPNGASLALSCAICGRPPALSLFTRYATYFAMLTMVRAQEFRFHAGRKSTLRRGMESASASHEGRQDAASAHRSIVTAGA